MKSPVNIRSNSLSETDKEASPESNKCNNVENDNILSYFTADEQTFIKNAFDSTCANLDDPILLVLHWNPEWLQNEANSIVRDQAITHFLANGATDSEVSGFLFHFQTYQSLLQCRDSLRVTVPNAFHYSPTLVAQFSINTPLPIPMAHAWIIMKTQVMATDYRKDIAFFCNSLDMILNLRKVNNSDLYMVTLSGKYIQILMIKQF